MRGYRIELFDEDKNLWGITLQVEGEDVSGDKGVVRSGITDALFWIKTQEDKRK